jgi:hypothetical protein
MDKTRQPIPSQHGNLHHNVSFKTFLITLGGKKESKRLIPNSVQKTDR